MTSNRPAFRVPRSGNATVVPSTYSRPYPKSYPASKFRRLNSPAGSIGVDLGLMSQADDWPIKMKKKKSTQHSDPIKEKLKPENFAAFHERMTTPTSRDDAISLEPEAHAAILCIANGIDPTVLKGQCEDRKSQLKQKLLQGQNEGKSEVSGNDSSTLVSTFGSSGNIRTNVKDIEEFQKRNKMWKEKLKSTLKYIRSATESATDYAQSNSQQGQPMDDEEDSNDLKLSQKAAIAKAAIDSERILQHGSKLLVASSSLKPKKESKEGNIPIRYTPPSKSYLEKAMKSYMKLPIYEKIQSHRQKSAKKFSFDAVQDDIAEAAKSVHRELRNVNADPSGTTSNTEKSTRPFDWVKNSTVAGSKNQQQPSTILPLKVIQGLNDGELSSFIVNHARRNPGLAKEFILGTENKSKSDPSQTSSSNATVRENKWKTTPTEASPRLPPLLSWTDETKDSSQQPHKKGLKNEDTGLYNKGLLPDIGLKLNTKVESSSATMKTKQKSEFKKNATIGSLKKLSFQDVTKSEFMREMRKYDFPMKPSKDEMRKSFLKTYILPHANPK